MLVWVEQTFEVTFSRSGLTDLLHRLGITYKLTTSVSCEANAAALYYAYAQVTNRNVHDSEKPLFTALLAYIKLEALWHCLGHFRFRA